MSAPCKVPPMVYAFLFLLSTSPITSAYSPGAQVTSLSTAASSPEGDPVYLWAQVKNTGNVYLDTNCFVWFYVTGPATNGYAGSQVCTANDPGTKTGSLAPGETRWYGITWVPTSAGDYRYYAIVQNHGSIISPWSSARRFKVTAKIAAAQVTGLSQIKDAYDGSPVLLWAQIKNTGNVNLSDTCFVRIYVSGPGYNGFAGYKSCTLNDFDGPATPLKPNEQRWYSLAWTPPQTGTYNYKAYVEYKGKPLSSWSNTQAFTVLQKTATASITQTRPIKAAFVGKKTTLSAEVQNTGKTGLSDNCYVRFYVKGPGINACVGWRACSSDEYGKYTAGPLKAGEKRWYTVEWTPPITGQYQYTAAVEYQGKEISKRSSPRMFFANPVTAPTTSTTKKTTTTTTPAGVKWDVYASFKTSNWKAYAPQIWGSETVDGAKYYARFTESDNTYKTYVRYCAYDGKYKEYPDTWHIERKYVSANKYKILVRGKSTPDCNRGQPENQGTIKINPESGWKITAVNKCAVSEDTQSSNNEYIATWCMADAVNGVVTWKSGSTCTGCCTCGNGAPVDIEITVEKQ